MSITYLDTSALLKLYIQEDHSDEVNLLVKASEGAGTNILTYSEMTAALSRAIRTSLISENAAKNAWGIFLNDWPNFTRLKLSTALTERAAKLAWDFSLRGYDAIHLAAALTWQDALEEPILMATFDRILWSASGRAGISVWPENLFS